MKARTTTIALGAVVLALFAASCAGAPKPPAEEAPPVEQPAAPEPAPAEPAAPAQPAEEVDPATESALQAARERAEASRKQAFDLGAPAAFPDPWKAAEASFLDGRDKEAKLSRTDPAGYRAATAAYVAAADAYDELSRKTLPLFAEARRQDLAKAREAAVAARAPEYTPDRFAAADAAADSAGEALASEAYRDAYAAWAAARDRYLALAAGAGAWGTKAVIDERDMAGFDAGNYATAGEKLSVAMGSYDAGDIAKARDAAEEAYLRYKLALAKGLELYATGRGKAADGEKQAALALKANVAVKDQFEAASAVYEQGRAAFGRESYEEAASSFDEAEFLFATAKEKAAAKRRAAEAAMAEAERRMAESERVAKDADTAIGGGN